MFIVTLLITSFMLVATVAFVAINESYSTANAITAARVYVDCFRYDNRRIFTSEAAPIGFGSTQINQINDSELASGGLGVTGAGHAMTIYVTPDALVFSLISSSILLLFTAIVYVVECICYHLWTTWRNRRKLEEALASPDEPHCN